MVKPGHFLLHSRVLPALTSGDYTLEVEQRITDADGTHYPTEPYLGHIRISSPRFNLPPDQILSTFPPANSEGAYESRLPQIVLKRRTLPWERVADTTDPKKPWLALVVIAEGEGSISAEVPVADCVTPGITLSGYNDVATSTYLSVPQSTVTKVFPTQDDLDLLIHVREVDITDTELAMGDDDGFLAVVIANRLPQYDRVGCNPVRYMACLINLEGQLDALPPPTPPVTVFDPGSVVFELDQAVLATKIDADHTYMGEQAVTTGLINQSDAQPFAEGDPIRPARAKPSAAAANHWSTEPASIEQIAVSASAYEVSSVVREAMRTGFRMNLEGLVQEKVYRFPVLTHWSFTCTGAGSFQSLMEGLDVGMLGTVAGRPSGKPVPECFTPPGGTAPPEAPSARPVTEFGETGHVGLPHRTRRGEGVRAWYRGPLVPHLTQRQTAQADGRPTLVHVSDQLRRLVPDGREDLSLAAAFEIGRLLALSQPSVVAALMRWRREQFGAARAKKLAEALLGRVVNLSDSVLVTEASRIGLLGTVINRQLVVDAAKDKERIFAAKRPLVDPGRPMQFPDMGIEHIIAEGFDLDAGIVQEAFKTGAPTLLQAIEVPHGAPDDVSLPPMQHLEQGLDAVLVNLVEDTVPQVSPGQTAPLRPIETSHADEEVRQRGLTELQRLLDGAASRVEGE